MMSMHSCSKWRINFQDVLSNTTFIIFVMQLIIYILLHCNQFWIERFSFIILFVPNAKISSNWLIIKSLQFYNDAMLCKIVISHDPS